MLPAAHRLRRSSDFAAVMRSGRRAGRGGVVVHLSVPTATPDPDMHIEMTAAWSGSDEPPDHAAVISGAALSLPTRVGFVVSKAVGGAVQRNAVKRRLRHLMAERLDQLPPGTTVVVRALPQAASASYQQLGIDLDAAAAAALRATRSGPRRRSE